MVTIPCSARGVDPGKRHDSFLYRLGLAASRRRWLTLGVWVGAVIAIFAIGAAPRRGASPRRTCPRLEVAARLRPARRALPRPPAPPRPSSSTRPRPAERPGGRGHLDARGDRATAPRGRGHRPARPEPAGTLSEDGTIGFGQVSYDEPAVDLGTEPYERLLSAVERSRGPGPPGRDRWRVRIVGVRSRSPARRAHRPARGHGDPADRVRVRRRHGSADRTAVVGLATGPA